MDFLTSQQLQLLADKYGTPLYAYNADKIKIQYQRLQQAFSGGNVKFYYACKALTNIHILKFLKKLGSNIDCSSINEVKLALLAGFEPTNILYTSNGIAFAEIEEAVSYGVKINIDSLSNLEKFGEKYKDTYPVGVRLRPNIMAGGNLKISTGHAKSKFGIPVNQVHELEALMNKYHLNISNLHIHTGSDIKDVDVFLKGIEVLFEILPLFRDLNAIDLGGGFKVPYKTDEQGVDMDLLGKKVLETFAAHAAASQLEIWFEPGKFLTSECGYLITTVNVIKQSADITFAGVNSGLNHLIRPMFYNAYHRIENIDNLTGPLKEYTITGYICETDTFAEDRMVNEIKEGDRLVFYNAGSYGFEMSSNFNSRLKPAEVMVVEGKDYLIRRADVFEDLLRNLVEETPGL